MALKFNFKTRITNCTGAEVKMNPDGTFDVRWVKLSLDKKAVHIEAKKKYPSTLAKIAEQPLGNLAIILTGRGLLIKKTKKLEELTEHNLQHLFPNFKLSEFYVQNFISGEDSFISIVRKETADVVIAAFEKQGMKILILSLGPFVSDQILQQLNVYGQELNFDGHKIRLNEDKSWKDYVARMTSDSEYAFKIEMEVIQEHFILAYAAAFQLILHEALDLVEVEETSVKENLLELSSKLKFEKRGAFALMGFFISLLLNFVLFNFYNAKNQELIGRTGQQSDQYADWQKLRNEVREKEILVKKLGWNKGLSYAFICDQLGQLLPKSIVLTELSVNEFSKNSSGPLKAVLREAGNIRLKGEAANVYAINDCMYALKQQRWVKDIQLEKYVTDDQKRTQVFTLVLNY